MTPVEEIPGAASYTPPSRGDYWRREVAGGLAGAMVAISIAMPVGALAFSPLGSQFAALGVTAGITTAALGGLVATIVGGQPCLRFGPMTAVCLLVAALITHLLPHAAGTAATVARTLTMVSLSIMLAGVLEATFGALGFGNAIRYVPYPVISGFRDGLALLILFAQVPPLLGLSHPPLDYDWLAFVNSVHPLNLIVGLLVASTTFAMNRTRFALFGPIAGLAAGTAVHYLLLRSNGAEALGSTVGLLSTQVWAYGLFTGDLGRYALLAGSLGAGEVLHIGLTAIGIALVGSVLSLLAAKVMDDVSPSRHSGNRVLMGQGFGNIVAGLLGGVAGAGSPAVSLASVKAGGRQWPAAAITSIALLIAGTAGAPLIARLPLAALAGVMIPIAWDVADGWIFQVLAELRDATRQRKTAIADAAIVVFVMALTFWVNIIVAVFFGIAISAIVFAVGMSRPVIRRTDTSVTRRSSVQRSAAQESVLRAGAAQIAILELDGPLFFGTAERLQDEILGTAPGARYVVLDVHRVTAFDTTATRLLQKLATQVESRGGCLVFAGITAGDARDHAANISASMPNALTFIDADRALEWAEDDLLKRESGERDRSHLTEMNFADMDLCATMDGDEARILAGVCRREAYAAGHCLFRRGDAGSALYLLAKGAVSITLPSHSRAGSRRLVTLREGASFGELSVLEGLPRSADAIFQTDAAVYVLTREDLDALSRTYPAIAIKILQSLSTALSRRLRTTTEKLHEL